MKPNQLFDKIDSEWRGYLENLKNGTVEEAIEHSYETAVKNELHEYVASHDETLLSMFSEKEIETILSQKNLLDDWYSTISGDLEYTFNNLQESFDETIRTILEDRSDEHETYVKEKLLTDSKKEKKNDERETDC